LAAYLVADVTVTDVEGYEEYRRQVPATIEAYGGRYLARGGTCEALEGDWAPNRFVILEFPDMDMLKAWYDSAEYRPLREIRNSNGDHEPGRRRRIVSLRPLAPSARGVYPLPVDVTVPVSKY